MLSGSICIWEEEKPKPSAQQTWVRGGKRYEEFNKVVDQAKAAGFLVGTKVIFRKGKHIGTITYFNSAFHMGYDENGDVCELHVKFDQWAMDCTHTDLELVK